MRSLRSRMQQLHQQRAPQPLRRNRLASLFTVHGIERELISFSALSTIVLIGCSG